MATNSSYKNGSSALLWRFELFHKVLATTICAQAEAFAHVFIGDICVLQFILDRKLNLSNFALFLDFDGTLVDIAPTPQLIEVTSDVLPLITQLLVVFESRVCIVSGRPLRDINHYLAGIEIDIVAEHGAVHGLHGTEASHLPTWPTSWTEHLLTLDLCIPNLVVEKKQTSIALHYRQQPELAPEVMKLAELLRNHAPSEYMIVNSNMTTEIRRSGVDKGTAINAVMKTPRYIGKRPIFIADDVTDIPGFDTVLALDGLALNVHTDFGGEPRNVRRWLGQLLSQQQAA
jgi:trehalose 6-phosphate phosphatase